MSIAHTRLVRIVPHARSRGQHPPRLRAQRGPLRLGQHTHIRLGQHALQHARRTRRHRPLHVHRLARAEVRERRHLVHLPPRHVPVLRRAVLVRLVHVAQPSDPRRAAVLQIPQQRKHAPGAQMRRDPRERRIEIGAPVPRLRNHHEIAVARAGKRVERAVRDRHARAAHALPKRRTHARRRIKRIEPLEAPEPMRLTQHEPRRNPGAGAQLRNAQRRARARRAEQRVHGRQRVRRARAVVQATRSGQVEALPRHAVHRAAHLANNTTRLHHYT